MSGWRLDPDNVLQTRDGFVAQQIRAAIMRGDFEPGQKLDQNEIAIGLNVSRSPVREALRTLASEGLVAIYPHRGAFVAELSLEELEEVSLIRSSLEGLAAFLSVPAIDDARIATLEAILEKLDAASDDRDEWLKHNREFHLTIYRAVNRPRLLALVQRHRNVVAPYIRRYITSPEHLQTSREDHQRILAACIKRDAELAQKETQRHLTQIIARTIAMIESEMSSAEDS